MTFLPLANETLDLVGSLGISGLGFGIVLAVLAVLAVFVILLSKIINKGKGEKKVEVKADAPVQTTPAADAPVAQAAPVEEVEADPEIPHIPGYVVLDGVSEQDAAVIMARVLLLPTKQVLI